MVMLFSPHLSSFAEPLFFFASKCCRMIKRVIGFFIGFYLRSQVQWGCTFHVLRDCTFMAAGLYVSFRKTYGGTVRFSSGKGIAGLYV